MNIVQMRPLLFFVFLAEISSIVETWMSEKWRHLDEKNTQKNAQHTQFNKYIHTHT